VRLCLIEVSVLRVQSALAVAFINIRIPLLIGGLVNVLSKYASLESANSATSCSFMEDIKRPAVQLISMYALQVSYLTSHAAFLWYQLQIIISIINIILTCDSGYAACHTWKSSFRRIMSFVCLNKAFLPRL